MLCYCWLHLDAPGCTVYATPACLPTCLQLPRARTLTVGSREAWTMSSPCSSTSRGRPLGSPPPMQRYVGADGGQEGVQGFRGTSLLPYPSVSSSKHKDVDADCGGCLQLCYSASLYCTRSPKRWWRHLPPAACTQPTEATLPPQRSTCDGTSDRAQCGILPLQQVHVAASLLGWTAGRKRLVLLLA